MGTIEFTTEERVNDWPVQSADETIFYVRSYDDSSIYVIHNGRKVTAAKCWEGSIGYYKCFGNSLYFLADHICLFADKIYRATFIPPDHISVEIFRHLEENETKEFVGIYIPGCSPFLGSMLFSKERNGKKSVYRACDDPSNGIEVDVNEEALEGCRLAAIHRGKLIYVKKRREEAVIALPASPKIIVIHYLDCLTYIEGIYADDDSPSVYFFHNCRLHALNTSTHDVLSLEILPSVFARPNSVDFYSLVIGIHGGKITASKTVMTREEDRLNSAIFLCTAPLPVEDVRTRVERRNEQDGMRRNVLSDAVNERSNQAPSRREVTLCSFCQYDVDDGTSVRYLPCAHKFHESCINEAVRHEALRDCPICRSVV